MRARHWHVPCLWVGVRTISTIGFLVFILLNGRAQTPPTIEFPFELRQGLIFVQVTVPQSAKPLNFMLDSGAGVSVVNLRTAQLLGLKLGNRVSVRGVQKSVGGYWPEHLEATVGKTFLPRNYLAVDLPNLNPVCDCGVDGLIGADFFREHVVQIDYGAKKIRLLKSIDDMTNADSVPLETRPCGLRVSLQVNGGKEEWMRLDTGCASALHWVSSPVSSERCSRRVAIGVANSPILQADTDVRLGRFQFKGVPAGLHDKEIFAGEAGLLGNGLLSRFSTVTIDVSAGRLVLDGLRPDKN